MTHDNAELLILAPARRLYLALTTQAGLQGWWTENCRIGDGVGEHSAFHFGDTRKIMRIAALQADREVRWTCTDSHIAAPNLKRSDE